MPLQIEPRAYGDVEGDADRLMARLAMELEETIPSHSETIVEVRGVSWCVMVCHGVSWCVMELEETIPSHSETIVEVRNDSVSHKDWRP